MNMNTIQKYRLDDTMIQAAFENDRYELQTLRGEIILLRALIEDRINMSATPEERAAAFDKIPQALSTLERLMTSCQKIEQQASMVLSMDAVRRLAESLGRILAEELSDPEVIDRVANRFVEAVNAVRN